MDSIKDVDVDPNGTFKYILIQVGLKDKSTPKVVVRGYAECPYHADIDDKFTEELSRLKRSGVIKAYSTKVLGGGRIKHDPSDKTLFVYGYSQGYGKANHETTVELLKETYPEYKITWSDEGY